MTDNKVFFLGIGAPRCGTTWLYKNLRSNSDVYLPPIKELRYFKMRRSNEELAQAVENGRAETPKDARDSAFYDSWVKTRQGDLAAYRSLFPDAPKVGEISPIYCTLNKKQVTEIKALFPDTALRAFFMMRNPMDRDISHIVFTMHRRKNRTEPYTDAEYLKYIDNPNFQKRSLYTRALHIWRAVIGDDLHCFYYDDLKADSEAFFSKFCAEMGVNSTQSSINTNTVNSSGRHDKFSTKLPDVVIDRLRERHQHRVQEMDFLEPARQKQWLHEIENGF